MSRTSDELWLDRILYDCRMSGGTMPIRVVVRDEAEKAQVRRLLKGRRHSAMIELLTAAEAGREAAP